MIIVKLIGGLGNQMFQYAAGRCLALKHHTDLFFDTAYLNSDPKERYTKRALELDVFNIDLKIATTNQIASFKINQSNKYTRTLQRNFPYLFSKVYAAESGSAYQSGFSQFPINTYLEGFWQSEKYFKSIESTLRKDFQIKEPLNSENEKWLNLIHNTISVSIHIRRGDYISSFNNETNYSVCSIDYYKKAIKEIQIKYSKIDVFVFSDDLEWCKENFKLDDTIHFVDANQKHNFYLDMYLMSQCKHNVIANSSFSWWAAWLNNNNDKIVIAPKNWYADESFDSKDLIPKTWMRI